MILVRITGYIWVLLAYCGDSGIAREVILRAVVLVQHVGNAGRSELMCRLSGRHESRMRHATLAPRTGHECSVTGLCKMPETDYEFMSPGPGSRVCVQGIWQDILHRYRLERLLAMACNGGDFASLAVACETGLIL